MYEYCIYVVTSQGSLVDYGIVNVINDHEHQIACYTGQKYSDHDHE